MLQRYYELGDDNDDCLYTQWFSYPYQYGICFGFQRIEGKVKDGLVLAVI